MTKRKNEESENLQDLVKVDQAVEAYTTNCVFYGEKGKCNFSGTMCGTRYCKHLQIFINKLNSYRDENRAV